MMMFTTFQAELSRYKPRVHRMYSGATEEEIAATEANLTVKLPKPYREFLHLYNGGSLFNDTLVIFGTPLIQREAAPDLVKVNQQKWPGMPQSFITIAAYNYGDEICLDTGEANFEGIRVVEWDHERGKVIREWPTLESWLDYELASGGRLYDYEGSQRRFTVKKLFSSIAGYFGRDKG